MVVRENFTFVEKKPVHSLVLASVVSSFSFLSALSIRDSITTVTSYFLPSENNNMGSKVLVTTFTALLFMTTTVILAYFFQVDV